jgi:hypothetical protein
MPSLAAHRAVTGCIKLAIKVVCVSNVGNFSQHVLQQELYLPGALNFNGPSPQRRTQRQAAAVSPHCEGAGPPSPLWGGGGGLVYGSRKNESGPTGLGMDSSERATSVGVGRMRWIVHVWEVVIRFEGGGRAI